MSVLIKDMEIPTSCTMCWLNTFCGVWNIETVKYKGFNKRLEDCPLTELIRCKDCKYAKKIYIKNLPWLKQWEYSCGYFNTHSVMGDGFCSQAEPRESGGE